MQRNLYIYILIIAVTISCIIVYCLHVAIFIEGKLFPLLIIHSLITILITLSLNYLAHKKFKSAIKSESFTEFDEITTLQPYFWKFAMDSVPDFFYAKDLQGRYLGRNKSMLSLYGHATEQAVIGKTNYDLYSSILDHEMLDQLEENDRRASYSAIPLLAEDVVPRANGDIMICESLKCSYRSPSGKILGMISVSRDVTYRKQAELALLKSQTEAQAANKAKSIFLANMSHEIRTPLNGIIGMLYLVQQTDLSTQQLNYIQKSESAAKRLLGVINDILDFSKIEANKLTLEKNTICFYEIMNNAFELYQTLANQSQIQIIFDFDSNIPQYLKSDALRLSQIINNLLSNAIKFTHQGSISLISKLKSKTPTTASVYVAVQDTGIGMSQEQINQLFISFMQGDTSTTRKYGGTGLGLVITKNLVQMLGSEICVESIPNQGSTFSFTIEMELADTNDINDNLNTEIISTANLQGRHILLVEDNAINQIIAFELLKHQGLIVTIAGDGLEAIEMIQNNTYDLVLMDIQMPNMDGLTATRTLRQNPKFANLPIIAMTAHAMSTDYAESLAAGMQDHITKPIDPELLIKTLVHWLP